MTITWILSSFFIGYTLGSIPFGLLLARMVGVEDIRKTGSGNIGATNVLRSGHKFVALATLLLDAGKGAATVLLVRALYTNYDLAQIAGLFAVLGHVFPVWLRFKGGKGVATTLGTLLAINWFVGTAVIFMWLMVFSFSRIASIASLLAIGYSGIIAYMLDNYLTALLCLNLAALIIYTHRTNIIRLLQGREPRFQFSASPI